MPGTVWCGAGSIASNYSHLGTFQGPDICCRDHDHCDIQISGLKYDYGVFNFRPHTVSHCDCDTRFRNCLMSLNDSIADFIGKTYFNAMSVPCFELKEGEACVEWNWMYMCTNYSQMPVAHLVDPSPYEPIASPTPTLQPGTQSSQDRKRSQKKWKRLRHTRPDGAGQRRRLGRPASAPGLFTRCRVRRQPRPALSHARRVPPTTSEGGCGAAGGRRLERGRRQPSNAGLRG
ncbi:phospholipase A2 isozymes PA3A/PA3B/PA5-like [Elgaria multicarinata webbii]|uniref:phospholipase A2 isozymes PA3A/PA3B/PA5-like n=1 Tax=Elgaria multicarinata webbii TaxID=159646 RepID=UPI002FCD4F90